MRGRVVVGALLAFVACAPAGSTGGETDPAPQVGRFPIHPAVTVSYAGASEEVCKVSNRAAYANNPLECSDLGGADLGIPVQDGNRTYILFGDTNSSDMSSTSPPPAAWTNAPDATGYFDGADMVAGVCGGLGLIDVAGLTFSPPETCSGTTAPVFAPDPVFAPTAWSESIGDFVFQRATAPGSEQSAVPVDAAVPGTKETPTGAFLYDGTIYTFYSGAPGELGSDPSVSYLTSWSPPSGPFVRSGFGPPPVFTEDDVHLPGPVLYTPFRSAANRQVVSKVDHEGTVNGWPSPAPLGGNFVQIAPVVSGGYLYLFGTGAYRRSHVSLARMPLSGGGPLSFPEYLANATGFELWTACGWLVPTATCDGGAAQPAALDDDATPDIGELSVQQYGPGDFWVMMYAPQPVGDAATLDDTNLVVVRFALEPNGPWSEPTTVFDMSGSSAGVTNRGTYCCQGGPGPTGCVGQQLVDCAGEDGGLGVGTPVNGLYAPYLFPSLTFASGDTYTVYYMLSSYLPYDTELMSFQIEVRQRFRSPTGG